MHITERSRSSTNCFTHGVPMRAVTFQSIRRTSSPSTYSRASANSMPAPRKTERYSPPSNEAVRRRVRISIVRMRASRSALSVIAGSDGEASRATAEPYGSPTPSRMRVTTWSAVTARASAS